MSNVDFVPSIITKLRSGQIDDPFISFSEPKKVINGQVQLSELPVFFNKVTASDGYVEVLNIDRSELQPKEYLVNYDSGIIAVHPDAEGKTITFSGKYRGNVYISALRVWTEINNGEVVKTLQDYIDNIAQFIHKGAYDNSTAYKIFNIVSYQSGTYMAIANTTGNVPTNTTYWRKLTGYQWRGTYSTATTYSNGDTVKNSTGDKMYQSIVDNNLNQSLTDASKWILILDFSSITTAEANRVEVESGRVSAETTRVNNENTRISNETSRSSAETTRISNETIRQNQESARQTNTATAISNAQTATTNANTAANTTKVIYKPYVNTYADIATTYPNPELGWRVQALDTKIVYRWDGSVWIPIEKRDSGAIVVVGNAPPIDQSVLWLKTNDTNELMNIWMDETPPLSNSMIWLKPNN